MEDFIIRYGACILLCAVGLFFVIMTYGAKFAERSGVPFVGGLFIAIGFLTSPVKWLALLGLIDPGYLAVPYFLILDHIRQKRFDAVYSEQDYIDGAADAEKQLRIWIPDRNEKLFRPYITRHIYELKVPKLLFSVCMDKTGKRLVLADKCVKGGNIEISAFDDGRISFTGFASKNAEMTVEIEIVKKTDVS